MRAVVDANVIAYYLLGNPVFEAEAREFWETLREPFAPAVREAELANVVSTTTLFVELAEREGVPLVTFDQRLLKSWPAIACRPAEVGVR